MSDDLNILTIQLDRMVKMSGARWAVWLEISDREWVARLHSGLTKTRRKEVEELLKSPVIKTWMAGAQSSGRMRSRHMGKSVKLLGCDRIYFFPNPSIQSAIMVGCHDLKKEVQEFFKILALSDPFSLESEIKAGDDLDLLASMDAGLNAPFHPEKIFNWVLDTLSKALPVEASYLAIRVGEIFRVEACWNYDRDILGNPIPIYSSRELRLIQAPLRGIISSAPFPEYANKERLSFIPTALLTTPIFLGRRIIGIMVFVSAKKTGLSAEDRDKSTWMLERLAHVIESAIVFQDVTHYLQESTLLSELVIAATIELEPAQIARRLVRRLSRTFRTDRVDMLLVSPDGKHLNEFGDILEAGPLPIPISDSVLGSVVETGMPLRTGDMTTATKFSGEAPAIQSMLAAPLKYQGKIVGVIRVESQNRDAFTAQDEQLLVVIASQLAGIIESVRSMLDASKRAKNLGLFHQVLEAIIGITNVREIATVTTALIAEYFHYKLVSILLSDPAGEQLILIGAGGPQANNLESDLHFSIQRGITGRAYRDGKGCYSNDVSLDPDYDRSGNWVASAELAVPLCSSNQILGVLDCQRSETNTFGEDDVLLMESLAGILASVLLNARRFEESQQTITQLELIRETALEISNLELDELITRIIKNARLILNARGAELGLLERENNWVRVVASENPWYKLEEGIRPLGAGVTGRIAQSGKPFSVANYNKWEGRLFPNQPHPCTAVAGVPLMIKGEVIGTLVIMDDTPGRIFSEYDLHLLELLAPQVAVSIRNARLYLELQERIEAQAKAEHQLLQSARMAAAGRLTASIAHEINNPLQALQNCLDLVSRKDLDAAQRQKYLDLAISELNRLMSIVDQMLSFYRPIALDRKYVDLKEVIQRVMDLLQLQFDDSAIHIHRQIDPEPLITIAVADQIQQVLLNLLINAIEALPDGGDIWISSKSVSEGESKSVEVIIEDSGPGIHGEQLEHLFEPLVSNKPHGTGLGLAVSYGIVEAHGGTLKLLPGGRTGACFQIILPRE